MTPSTEELLHQKQNPGLTLALLVLRIAADNEDDATSAYNLALFAHFLDRRPNFHCRTPP